MQILSQKEGECRVYGLSTDTKLAVATSSGFSFYEIDTGKSFLCNGSTWNEVTPASAAAWGSVTGTLANQTDLQGALDAKGTSNFSGAYGDLSGKPTLGSAAAAATTDFATAAQGTDARTPLTHSHAAGDVTGTAVVTNDARLSDARPASDVSAWAKAASKPTYTAAEVGADASGAAASAQAAAIAASTPVAHAALTTTAHGGIVASNDARLTDSRPASDVSAWAKAGTKPAYTAAEVGALAVAAAAADVVVSGTNIAAALSGKLATGGTAADVNVSGTTIAAALSGKQATLVSATNIKTINGASVLGSGDLTVSASTIVGITGTIAQFNTACTDADFATGGGTATGTNTGDNATNSQYSGLAASKQDTLVSATNIKTINGATILGSGNMTVSAGDPSYSPGSFTVATETQRIAPHRLKMTTTQRITIEGTGRLSCIN